MLPTTILPEPARKARTRDQLEGRVARLAARKLAGRMRRGTLDVVDSLGHWRAGLGDPSVFVEVHDLRAYSTLVRGGSVGLGSGYVSGFFDTEDLTGLVRLLLDNVRGSMGMLDGVSRAFGAVTSPLRKLVAPDAEDDRRNVRAHYDLPGELFEAMLDETMAYSCAVFETEEATLGDAQRAKFDRLCRKLDLRPHDHLVEIGTGWGGLALHAASNYGCKVTTTTISDAQLEVASKRVVDAGLADRITLVGRDYRELGGRYDKLVAVEMIEAVDWRRHETFFSTCERLILPDGLMALQAIVIEDRSYDRARQRDDFITRMVFPGGCLPSVSGIVATTAKVTDLRLVDLEDIGRHYAETLRRWRAGLATHWEELASVGLGPEFRRLWFLYLSYCEAAFLERHISDVQMVFARSRWRARLSTRQS